MLVNSKPNAFFDPDIGYVDFVSFVVKREIKYTLTKLGKRSLGPLTLESLNRGLAVLAHSEVIY